MNLEEFSTDLKISWNNFYVSSHEGTLYENVLISEITSEEFLKFAKEDFRHSNKRSLVNAISNAKRAIDNQIDWILSFLGFDYLKFNEKEYPGVKDAINQYECKSNIKLEGSIKIKFIQALNIAPGFLISKIRKIRNNLEHEYILPSNDQVREAIEVADLFINATQNILIYKALTDYYVGNEMDDTMWCTPREPYIHIYFNKSKEQTYFSMSYTENNNNLVVNVKDKEYIPLLKVAIGKECNHLPLIFGRAIEEKYINYEFRRL